MPIRFLKRKFIITVSDKQYYGKLYEQGII